jgi:hypothetical protein
MKRYEFRRTRSWNMPEHRPLPIGLAIVALALVGMQLAEVWQSARVAELSLRLDRSREALSQVQARLEHVRAEGAARTTRTELARLATPLKLVPADARQFVTLPAEYLAADGRTMGDGPAGSLQAWAERVSRTFVPEASARPRARD